MFKNTTPHSTTNLNPHATVLQTSNSIYTSRSKHPHAPPLQTPSTHKRSTTHKYLEHSITHHTTKRSYNLTNTVTPPQPIQLRHLVTQSIHSSIPSTTTNIVTYLEHTRFDNFNNLCCNSFNIYCFRFPYKSKRTS